MNKKVKILYTIPNFDTAGSGIPLFKIASSLDKEKFSVEIACLHERGELFKDIVKNGFKVHIIDLYKKPRPIANMLYQCYKLSLIFQEIKKSIQELIFKVFSSFERYLLNKRTSYNPEH